MIINRRYITLIISCALLFCYGIAQAQESNPAEEVFGKNFNLTVDPEDGVLKYNFSEEEQELESIIAENGVVLESDKLSLKCDKFDFDAKTKKLVALGEIVEIEQEGISAVCGKFIYDPEADTTRLQYSPRIVNKDQQGRMTRTQGDDVTIERQEDGSTMVHVVGSANLSSQEGSGSTPVPAEAAASARKMFGRQFEIITGKKGELLYVFTTNNELRSIVAHNEVFVNSEQVDLYCDRLEFYSRAGKLLAMGKPVKIFQDALTAECGRFEYYPDEGKTLLLEDPVILNKGAEGRAMETRGDEIVIVQKNEGQTTITVKGKPSIMGEETEGPIEEPADEEETGPIPVDESSVSKIQFLDVSED